ncbi:hypothetical protein LL912_11010 [Niabella sp. CC-SYL272]|uniref:hypothetical protein n=1 Tax=Niabella agricola TaxID=2891571 RepID=UPI001F3A2187|nr:hypothetical protein [Niabella agricola]MCF3109310.1 hypothetical protein [Niabella agricola]
MLKKITAALLMTIAVFTLHAQSEQDLATRFRIAASGGYAYRLGKKPLANDYYKDIARGPVFDVGLYYFFNHQSGTGIKYSEFSSFGSGNIITGQFVRSNVKIRYIGPVYQSRLISQSGRFHFLSAVSLGYMSFRDNAAFDQGSATLKGGTLGAMAELGSDLRIVRNLFAGAAVSVYGGSISTMHINGTPVKLEAEKRESLSRIEASLGIRYYFF